MGSKKYFQEIKMVEHGEGIGDQERVSPGPIYASSSPTYKLTVQRWVAKSSSTLPKAKPRTSRNQHKSLQLFLRQWHTMASMKWVKLNELHSHLLILVLLAQLCSFKIFRNNTKNRLIQMLAKEKSEEMPNSGSLWRGTLNGYEKWNL